MAHPKLSKLVGRSVLTVSTAALIAGPFAGIASAQVDLSTDVEKILVDGELVEAVKVDGVWVDPITLEPIPGANEVVEKASETTKKTVQDAAKVVTKPSEQASEGGSDPTPLPEVPGEETDPTDPVGGGGGKQGGAGSTPDPISEPTSGSNGGSAPADSTGGDRGRDRAEATTPPPARHYLAGASGQVDFNPGVSPWSGFSTMSSLTLQPFEEPIAAPGAYGLPGAAADLFLPEAAPAATSTAGTAITPTSAGASSTTAPPTWLLATSTGLLMLVGAGHFVRATTRNLNPNE